jgi:non-ribosomal peptide synthetase component E (peptide arylation enzyme)
VRSAAVFGRGDRLHAVVVASGDVTADDLKAHARATFGQEHYVPAEVDFADALPLTDVGKVDKRALAQPVTAP